MTIRNLDALLQPKSIALIGATDHAGSVGATVARNLTTAGFRGSVSFVNPKYRTLLGQPCFHNLSAVPLVPELAVIATPPATIPQIAREAAERGTRALAVITAGLDAATKQQMLDAGRSRLVRVLGPNSIGLLLPPIGLNASFSHIAALPGDLAFASQSGALVTAVIDWASARQIGFSQILSLGDMVDVDFGDVLDYLAGDIRSRAILLYMEAVTHAPKFLSAARRAARAKPVIAIKAGRHTAAARAAASHTGRLAGQDSAYEAAFRRAGVLRVTALEDLFEAAEMLARMPRLGGERLMVLTNGGGAGVLAADHLEDEKGVLAELATETRRVLDRHLPPGWSKGNPVDVIGDAGPDRYGTALEGLFADRNADAILAINCPTALASSSDIAKRVLQVAAAASTPKPLLTNWLGDSAAAEARRLFRGAGIPTFETPRAAVGGFMHLVRHLRAQEELIRTPPAMPEGPGPNCDATAVLIQAALAAGRTTLTEVEGKEMLAAYGIPTVPTSTAKDPDAAAMVASRLLATHKGVALKIWSDDITHKSDVGGVILDLTTPDAVRTAATTMHERIHDLMPAARINGFTLSPLIRRPKAYELLAGMSVDENFGPMIMFGAGGTAVEVVADTAMALPPLDLKLARDLIACTRIARLLDGFRDRKPVDLNAVAQALVRLSALIVTHPEIRELDINPLLADENGVIALDARVRIADQSREPRTPLAIKPYPANWQKQITVPALGPVLLRPIRPEDERLYEAFLERVTPEDMRLRLFAPQKELSHKFLARLTQIDYAREMAFVAIAGDNGELLGVSRFAADPDYTEAEYAILVRSDLKGRGIGWALMQQLIDYARETGMRQLFGSVLSVNTNMLRMCSELGFRIEADPDDSAVRLVRLDVEDVSPAGV